MYKKKAKKSASNFLSANGAEGGGQSLAWGVDFFYALPYSLKIYIFVLNATK